MTTARNFDNRPRRWALAALTVGVFVLGSPMAALPAMAAVPSAAAAAKASASKAAPSKSALSTTATPKTALAAFPVSPPAAICGNTALLSGPATPPAGAVIVAAGDNSGVTFNRPGATYWFAPGTHTLGGGMYNQILPASNTTFVGGPGAVIDGGGVNDFAFTTTSPGVTIRYLTIQGFVAPQDQGVVNHDSGVGWTVQYNTIQNSLGAAVMVGPGNVVSYNCLRNNGQYGFNAYAAAGNSNITIDHDEITGNDTAKWNVSNPGCGCFGGGKLWKVTGGTVTNNWVHDNHGPGIWADANNSGLLIDGNYISDNDNEAIIYEISYNGRITNNNILRNAIVEGKMFAAQNTTFPVGAIYISESGGDGRIDGGLYTNFEIAANNLLDNWGGVVLWENSDRFCGSPSSGSSVLCTAVNPTQANLSTCVPGTINSNPYYSDCRWKTQNVSVHDNTMSFSRTNVGCTTSGCGQQALFSNWGTFPNWSPYQGSGTDTAVTTQQNNHFTNNTYIGDWQFGPAGTIASFAAWQAAPYNQDPGSTLNGPPPPPASNLLDADTSGLEGSLGHWTSWYSATPTRSTSQAQSGAASLRIDITSPNGWGIQINNWPGFTAAPGPQTINFWALAGSGNPTGAMQVQWRDAAGHPLRTDSVNLPTLTTTWQQAIAAVTAPAGTANVSVAIAGTAGASGNYLYLDQIAVG